LYLLARLTARDWRLLTVLADHQVLTTNQLCELAFPSLKVAQRLWGSINGPSRLTRHLARGTGCTIGGQPWFSATTRKRPGSYSLAQRSANERVTTSHRRTVPLALRTMTGPSSSGTGFVLCSYGSIAANARNKIIFSVSPDDARILSRHVGPYLTADDVTRLDRYQAACRLVVDSRDTTGFTLATQAATPIRPGAAQAARTADVNRGRSTTDRRREQLARRWTPPEDSTTTHLPDQDTTETDTETVLLPVSAAVWPAVSQPPLDTPTDTGRSNLPPAPVKPAECSESDKSDSWVNR
jgi:hypothetical protein